MEILSLSSKSFFKIDKYILKAYSATDKIKITRKNKNTVWFDD